MINLLNDYNVIAHPKVIETFNKYQQSNFVGYGLDTVSINAKELIKKELKNNDVEIHFIIGGTMTNKVAVAQALRVSEAVICCDSAHINVHETGAIESIGHKVLTAPNSDGKLRPEAIEEIYLKHVDEHMVKPKMVYISNSTEYGTIYNKEELKAIYSICKKYGLYLYLDGARLSAALTSKYNDLTLEDLCSYTDMFYIGGAKSGLLFGEALVIINNELKNNVRYVIKNLGAMYSKGFIAGMQFETLFTNGLFYEIGKYENDMAYQLSDGLEKLGIELYCKTITNQIFLIVDKKYFNKIKEQILFEVWEERTDSFVIRFVTSFTTTSEDVKKTLEIIGNIINE